MKLTKSLQNVLVSRGLFSLAILLFIRVGTFLPVPVINHVELANFLEKHSVAKNLISTFSGENTFVIGLFTLNIFPYINATILAQLLVGLSPKLAKLQKEGDFEGRRTLSRLTRWITLVVAILQSIGISFYIRPALFEWNFPLIVLWLTTGAMIVLWLSEMITQYGFGNGASLLIYTNIISNLPTLLKKLVSENSQNFTIPSFIAILLLMVVSLYGIVFLQTGTRKIPLISSKQLNQSSFQTSVRNFLPLRFNQAGVMPIILTTAMLVVPNYIVTLGIFPWFDGLMSWRVAYWVGYFVLVLMFSSFYTTIILNPKDISDQFQKMAVSIPGIRPGVQTTFYLKRTIRRITLIGATMLAILTVVPNLIESTFSVTGLTALSTTSLLILAGVILDLIREANNLYYSNVYTNIYD